MKTTFVIRDGKLVEKPRRRPEIIVLPWPDGSSYLATIEALREDNFRRLYLGDWNERAFDADSTPAR